jgi:hypothetical protein
VVDADGGPLMDSKYANRDGMPRRSSISVVVAFTQRIFHKNVPVADRQSLDGNADVVAVDVMVVDEDVDEDSYTSEASTTSKRPAQCELYSVRVVLVDVLSTVPYD